MKLYFRTQSRALRPRWMLQEIGAPYELVRLEVDTGTKTPEYLKLTTADVMVGSTDPAAGRRTARRADNASPIR